MVSHHGDEQNPPTEIKDSKRITMFAQSARIVTRQVAAPVARQQKRGIVGWMTNQPDKVMELKKLQQTGGTCQGEYNPTWLKQPGDNITLIIGAALVGYGSILTTLGFYKLATGKGKKE